MPLSAYAKDTFVAPYMSSFTEAEIVDMSACDPQQEHWVSNFILNPLLRTKVRPPHRQYMFNYLRRVEAAFREYASARDRTLLFLSRTESPSNYMAAIAHWEFFLLQAWVSFELLGRIFQLPKGSLFKKNDGSVLQRLNLMYNVSKHAAEGDFPEDGTLAVWLANDGLHSRNSHLTFDKIANEILRDFAVWADRLQDPLTLQEKIEAAINDVDSSETAAGST